MSNEAEPAILAINLGSSSLKFALYRVSGSGIRVDPILSGKLERIAVDGGQFVARDDRQAVLVEQQIMLPNYGAALKAMLDWLKTIPGGQEVRLVGHRVVRGGAEHNQPQLVTPALLRELKDLIPLAPDHLPQELEAIEIVQRLYPKLQQVVCFDTAFHRTMPRTAQLYGLPMNLAEQGIIRYGFHGLSYEYIVQELAHQAGEEASRGRIIVAHFGNGASLAAIRGGRSVDTTMGFTPTGGLPMSTRSGDLDPGVIVYLLQERNYSPSQVNDLVTKKGGLLGLSGVGSDMKDLLAKERESATAAEAIAVFCYQAKRYIGALAAALGGLDTLVFTGGIGENASEIRQRICSGLEFLGINLGVAQNDSNGSIISRAGSAVTVRVIQTNEELMIAQHARDVSARIERTG
ncbi:MAG: acetate/propionate family kinase [Terriglobia bacterium]